MQEITLKIQRELQKRYANIDFIVKIEGNKLYINWWNVKPTIKQVLNVVKNTQHSGFKLICRNFFANLKMFYSYINSKASQKSRVNYRKIAVEVFNNYIVLIKDTKYSEKIINRFLKKRNIKYIIAVKDNKKVLIVDKLSKKQGIWNINQLPVWYIDCMMLDLHGFLGKE